jgi:hypothetical protein
MEKTRISKTQAQTRGTQGNTNKEADVCHRPQLRGRTQDLCLERLREDFSKGGQY